ncbi:serine O-acetyltransferase [Paenibacillus lautus]|uniref:serine O-acetyltransferase n=1 Tax=Paenibacillus lautus TaxID=1401 RepID=UPI00384D03CF
MIKSDFIKYDNKMRLSRFIIFFFLGIGPFQAVALYRLSRFFKVNNVPFIHSILTRMNIVLNGTEISADCKIGPGFFLAHTTGVVIGRNAEVGKNLLLFHNTTIGARTPFDGLEEMPIIGDNVKIYTGVKVLGNIQINNDCTLGANTVITFDLEKGSTIVENRDMYKVIKKHVIQAGN